MTNEITSNPQLYASLRKALDSLRYPTHPQHRIEEAKDAIFQAMQTHCAAECMEAALRSQQDVVPMGIKT